jgi:hypothetical protein
MPANYVLLERIELNASAASVTFANIPQSGYTDLKLVMSARNVTNTETVGAVYFNSDTTDSNYRYRRLLGDGSAASSLSGNNPYWFYMDTTGETASTFSNCELYIPNYNVSGISKSISSDAVTENNATSALAVLTAGLWTSTSAINAIQIRPYSAGGGSFAANSTFSLYGLAAVGTTPAIAPKASGGDVIDFDGTYWIHTFLTSGTFTPQTGLTCDYLVVAGGGGGSSGGNGAGGGGGGAGGYRTGSLSVATSTTVTIGAGGAGGVSANGTQGANSVFSSITSTGGGFGAVFPSFQNSTGGSGGSGGGASSVFNGFTSTGGSATSGQGNAGGIGTTQGTYAGGGGGGAGAVGSNGGTNGGNGGNGLASSISGTSVTYAGGGGGGTDSGNAASSGGTGGGGAGRYTSAAVSGTTNRGGGGGGSSGVLSNAGGNGGSGIVIVRYLA